eukprot:9491820-Alexandrium_andersonii.AAC.1
MARPATSAGPDGWMPAEFKLFTATLGVDLLAAICNAIEERAAWPQEVLKALAVALPKNKQVE